MHVGSGRADQPAGPGSGKVKIGFVTDMSSLYADVDGKNGAIAMQMAIEDFGGRRWASPSSS